MSVFSITNNNYHEEVVASGKMCIRDRYFYAQLDKHFPGMKERYIRTYGNSYEIPSPDTRHLLSLVKEECRKTGMVCSSNRLFEYMHTFEDKQAGVQMSLFE